MTKSEYIVKVPLSVINATHQGGYYDLYIKNMQRGMKSKEAWEDVEDSLAEYGLPKRYNSYESFRRSMYKPAYRRSIKEWGKKKRRRLIPV